MFGQAGKYSVIMKKVPLPIVEFNRCQNELQKTRLGDKFRLDSSFICAGGVEGVDTCKGIYLNTNNEQSYCFNSLSNLFLKCDFKFNYL